MRGVEVDGEGREEVDVGRVVVEAEQFLLEKNNFVADFVVTDKL